MSELQPELRPARGELRQLNNATGGFFTVGEVNDTVDVETLRLAKLDSPRRVAWLRQKVRAYVINLAGRAFFRLPAVCAGFVIDDPKSEAIDCSLRLGTSHGLTGIECATAFKAEWGAGMKAAVQVGDKLRMAALSHIKVGGSTAALGEVLRQARNRFPAHWPFLTDDNLCAIAAGFPRRPKPRRPA